jgi:hypothetical protein
MSPRPYRAATTKILRGAKERLDAQQRPAAPVLELVKPE